MLVCAICSAWNPEAEDRHMVDVQRESVEDLALSWMSQLSIRPDIE